MYIKTRSNAQETIGKIKCPELIARYSDRRSLYKVSDGAYDMWHDGTGYRITANSDAEAIEIFDKWCNTHNELI